MNQKTDTNFTQYSIFFNLPVIAFALDTHGYIHVASKEFTEKWANNAQNIGKSFDQIVSHSLLEQLSQTLIKAYKGSQANCQLNYKVEGKTYYYTVTANPIIIKGRAGCIIVAKEDSSLNPSSIVQHKQDYIDVLEDSLNNLDIGMAIFNKQRSLISCNNPFRNLDIMPQEQLVAGLKLSELNKDIVGVTSFEKGKITASGSEQILNTKNNKTIKVNQHPLAQGGLCVTYTDISDIKHSQDQLEHQIYHDHLTGLPNFYAVLDSLKKTRKNHAAPKHLVFIDIDHFKLINGMNGHQMGDRILQEFTARIERMIDKSKGDLLSRLSHDEFLLLIHSTIAKRDLEIKVQEVMTAVSKGFTISGQTIYLTISAGICEHPADDLNIEQAIAHAGAAMSQAKALGRNRYLFYNDTIGYHLKRRARLSHDMKTALQEDIESFTSVFQPIYDLHSQEIVSAEILLRWGNKHNGKIQPSEFIKIAEDTGLIIDLGDILIKMLTSSLKRLQKINPALNLSINVSPLQLTNNNFVDTLFSAIKENNLDPKTIIIELTESELIGNSVMSAELLDKLAQNGHSLAIDDFGTGYSSLSYIRRYPFSILKIDQSFIQHIPNNPDYNSIIDAVADIAGAFNMDVVAEGIENEAQLDYLKQRNCQYGQGYHFAKPMSLDKFENLLTQQKSQLTESLQ